VLIICFSDGTVMMSRIGVIVVVAFMATVNLSEGKKFRKFGIVGGEETTISKFPYQVGYLVNGKLKCGGSIISSNCILTAGEQLVN
jgi:hypothetical protein